MRQRTIERGDVQRNGGSIRNRNYGDEAGGAETSSGVVGVERSNGPRSVRLGYAANGS